MSHSTENAGSGKTIIPHSLRLAAFTLGTAILLMFANNLTKAQIASQRVDFQRQLLNQVLPQNLHDNDLLAASFQIGPASKGFSQLELLGLSTVRSGYVASQKGAVTGMILPLETAYGYGGPIVLAIGIAVDGSITGVRVLQHSETPGLGGQINVSESPWINGFNQHSLTDTPAAKWQVKMDGGNFDEFVGATITPRAVVAAVYSALVFFEANKSVLLAVPVKQESR